MDANNANPDLNRADPVIEAYKKDIDLTLRRENLKLTVEERLIKLQRLAEFAEELRRAGREARRNQWPIPAAALGWMRLKTAAFKPPSQQLDNQ